MLTMFVSALLMEACEMWQDDR